MYLILFFLYFLIGIIFNSFIIIIDIGLRFDNDSLDNIFGFYVYNFSCNFLLITFFSVLT